MDNHKKACELGEQALTDALEKIDDVDEDTFRDAKSIIELLKENLSLWKEEEGDNIEDLWAKDWYPQNIVTSLQRWSIVCDLWFKTWYNLKFLNGFSYYYIFTLIIIHIFKFKIDWQLNYYNSTSNFG